MGFELESDNLEDFMSLLNAIKSEDLYSLFCGKEKIEADIADIEWSNIIENRKNLLEELWLEREKIFERFYDFYWEYDEHVNYLTDFIESQWDTWKTYGENGMTLYDLIIDADKILHEKLYRIIFDTVWKDEIKDVISWKHLKVDKVLSRVSIMVKYYFEVRNGVIRNNLKRCIQDSPYFAQLIDEPNCTVDDYINQFIDYYENDTLDHIFKELEHVKIGKDYDFVDLEGNFGNFVTSIDLCLLAKFTNTLVFKWFLEFCSDKNGNNWESEEIPEYRSGGYVYWKVCWFFDEIFPDFKRKDILEWLDFVKVTKDSFSKSFDVLGRILKNLKIRDNWIYNAPFNTLDVDKIENAEQLFQKNKWKIYPQLKEYFFNEVSKFLFNWLSLDLDDIILDLRKKYEYAKSHVWDVSKKQRDEMEKKFLKNEKDKFRTKFFGAFSKYSDFFDCLELKEFFVVIELFMLLFGDTQIIYKENLNEDYKEFVKTILEEKFKKSHNNAKPKQPVVPVVKKRDKDESVVLKHGPTNTVTVRKELPGWLVSDLEKYFWWKIHPDFERSLRNSWWVYKKPRFDKFWVDDWFFKILNRFWICEDIPEEETAENTVAWLNPDSNSDSQNDTTDEVDEDLLKLKNLIENIKSTDVDENKVDYYVQAFVLFYDFKDVDSFKSQILESIKCDNRILKWIESVLEKILKGQKEELKTSKNWKKRYFTFDVGYNTWYRIVLNGQQWKSRKIIIDFVDHDTYMVRIPSYLRKY